MRARLFLTAGVTLALVGCASTGRQVEGAARETGDAVADAGSAAVGAAREAGDAVGDAGSAAVDATKKATDDMEAESDFHLPFVTLNQSGATGHVMMEETGDQTRVMVHLEGATPGNHPGHIHRGTCEQMGEVLIPLQPVTVAANGKGMATSTVTTSIEKLEDGDHIVLYHRADGTPIVCAEIED